MIEPGKTQVKNVLERFNFITSVENKIVDDRIAVGWLKSSLNYPEKKVIGLKALFASDR